MPLEPSSVADRRLELVSITLIAAALIFAFLTRVVSVFHYIDFYGDEARFAGHVMDMWQGIWPAFGPHPYNQPFGLPPLYFYLAWPLSALGPNPVFQALLNAILSFCSVPLLGYLVYRLLDGVARQQRLLLSSIAALWWSVSYVDIQLNNKEWNPSLIPFFLMCLALLYATQLQEKLSPSMRALCWILYGVVAAILVSLHGSTLFIIPVIFCASLLYYVVVVNRNRKARWVYPALAVASMLACLTPYWGEELRSHWANTQTIFATIHSAAAASAGLSTKISNAASAYFSLISEMYFPVGGGSIRHASSAAALGIRVLAFIFFVATPLLAIAYFRGNKLILGFMAAIWVVYLYAASNFLAIYVHYKMPIVLAPMILGIGSLAYLNYKSAWGRVAGAFLLVCVLLSMLSNVRLDLGYLAAKFGSRRLVTTSDIAQAFQKLPAGATVCSERQAETNDQRSTRNRDFLAALGYIDRFETNKNLKFVWPCAPGDYLIHSRYAFAHDPYFLPVYQDLRVVQNPEPGNDTQVVARGRTYLIELLR